MKKLIITAFVLLLTLSVFAQSSTTSRTSTEKTSVSVSNSDHDYAVIATFSSPKADRLKQLIIKNLGKPDEDKDNIAVWSLKNSYNIILRPGRLIIDMAKDKTDAALVRKFERLGAAIQPTLDAK